MKKPLLITLFGVLVITQVNADEKQQRVEDSKAVVKEFMGKLKGELESAMKAGGPIKAIEVCNKVAPGIAQSQSEKTGWKVARTSLKPRNQENAPDAWETKVLQSFEERKQKGEDVQQMGYAEMVEEGGKKSFRFMKAIPTGEVCLNCHGGEIKPEVQSKLKELYPNDKATGYKLGDIRGAFTIQQPL